MPKKPIEWLCYRDELERYPGLLDGMGFVVTGKTEYSVNIDVYSMAMGGDPVEDRKVCSLYVKWDGCSHMSMPTDHSMHLCGSDGWAEDMDLIRRAAFTIAAREIANFSHEVSRWVDDRPLTPVKEVEFMRDLFPAEIECAE